MTACGESGIRKGEALSGASLAVVPAREALDVLGHGLDAKLDPAAIVAMLRPRLSIEIDVAELFAAMAVGDGPPLVDARSTLAYAQGRIGDAVRLTESTVADIVESSRHASPVIVYGSGHHRLDALRGALLLAEAGAEVRLLAGGFPAWVAEGFPVARPWSRGNCAVTL